MSAYEDNDNQNKHAPSMGMHMHGGHDDDEHDGAPEWLISFADLVMLIMGFFVILYALNATQPVRAGTEGESDGVASASVPFDKWAEFVWNTRQAFGNPIDVNTTDPELKKVVDWYYTDGPGRADDVGEEGDREEVKAPREATEQSIMIDLKFADGSDRLTDRAREALARLAEEMRGLPTKIDIHGHASQEETGRDVEHGLDLAYRRAKAVRRCLVDNGIASRRLEISAMGANDPLNLHPSNPDEDAPNRRVELRVTDRVAADPVRTEPASESR